MRKQISLSERLTTLLVYVVLLWLYNYWRFQEKFPTQDWLIFAVFPFLLVDLIVQPYFTSPRDALSNSGIATLVVLPLMFGTGSAPIDLHFSWWVALTFFLVVFGMTVRVISHSQLEQGSFAIELCGYFSSRLGSPKVLFSVLLLLVVFTFHLGTGKEFWLVLAWITVAFAQPVEFIVVSRNRIREMRTGIAKRPGVIGEVVSRHHPRLVTVRISDDEHPKVNSIVIFPLSPSFVQVGVVLDNYRLAEELWSRIMLLEKCLPTSAASGVNGSAGAVLRCEGGALEKISRFACTERVSEIVGVVIENSDANTVYIELYRDEDIFVDGQLVRIKVGEQNVLYQVVNGVTRSEDLHQQNRHGFTQITARKLGKWDSDKFVQVPWVPKIYEAVYKVCTENVEKNENYIGQIPGTNYGAAVSCEDLVTHNTAILGVLGSGKTSLAIELIQRMAKEKISVLVIDITGEYEKIFQEANISFQQIPTTVSDDAEEHSQEQFSNLIKKDLERHLNGNSGNICVFNPNRHNVKPEKGKIFSPAKATRVIADHIINYVSKNLTKEAKICLVLEEAHSLVPERGFIAVEGDSTEANHTARAIMQGRKHGFGCMIVTQRTAHVSKSILSQCNTVFALQVFDETGKSFLESYTGKFFSERLSSLLTRHCIVYGRGVLTDFPIILKLHAFGHATEDDTNLACKTEQTR